MPEKVAIVHTLKGPCLHEFGALLQDVKLRTAFCLCHVLRMHAPETPYSSRVLEVSSTVAADALKEPSQGTNHSRYAIPHH